jgi:hypothetical protein
MIALKQSFRRRSRFSVTRTIDVCSSQAIRQNARMDANEPPRRSLARAVLITLLVLLLPLLYVGSYLALVVPSGKLELVVTYLGDEPVQGFLVHRYRVGGEWLATAFMPLELIDRKVRPELWNPGKVEVEELTIRRP